mgnify:CR=1 FL=1
MGTMLTMVALSASLVTPVATPASARACLSPTETRESVATHQLREPMVLLRDAARETGKVDQDQRKQAQQKKMSSQMDDLREAMRAN